MKRWQMAVAAVVTVSLPLAAMAQTSFSGSGSGGNSFNGGGGSSFSGSSSGSSSGQFNTTMLGSNVNVGFNSVFGSNATLVNTNSDPFAAYRPTGSGSSTGVSNAFGSSSTTGNRTSTTGTNFGSAGTSLSGAGTTGNRATSLGTTGSTLGTNRTTMGNTGAGLNGQRNAFGNTGSFAGGGIFGNTGGFLGGGGMNNQQSNTPVMGYTVNFEGKSGSNVSGGSTGTLTSNVDLQQRLSSSPGIQGAVNLQVMMRGETAILRGQVGSDYARQLAAAMARLEPGVYAVENQLVIAPVQK